MTLRKVSLLVIVLSAGCAALPNVAGDDITCTVDACAILQPDGSADAYFGDAFGPTTDGGPVPASRAGLCVGDCSPDDPLACVGDAGVDAAPTQSCRIILGAGQKTTSTCGKSGTGGEGASCNSGTDCAPGYECVGTGTCRHYCCDDTTCNKELADASPYDTFFCDIANEHQSSGAVVPVCNVVVHCALFTDSCPANETCTIVEVNNNSSLVATCAATGTAGVNESCETTHCAQGLACIGAVGLRTCQQLCDQSHPCPSSSTCNTKSQALMNLKVGICGP
jgi:hypothetical protein